MSVTQQLEAAGGRPDAQPRTRKKSIWQFEITRKKVPRKELMHFSRQLAVFLAAGIPVLDALDAIGEEMGNKQLKSIVDDVAEGLRSGATFAGAVAAHADALPTYYIGILRSAELTGRLDTVLEQLADYLERDMEARRRVTSALAYPAVVLSAAVVVVVVLVGFVLPRFESFFASLDAELPLPTRMLLGITAFLTGRAPLLVGAGVLLGVALIVAVRTEHGRAARDRALLGLPVVGDLVRHVVLERFCRILGAMLSAGVQVEEALRVATDATSNMVFRSGLETARESMLRGDGLATPLIASGLFPASARQMFRVGETTGTFDRQLETAATYFDREVEYKIKRFTALFEPAVLLVVGVVVGFVAIALVSAMYGIFSASRGGA